LSVETCVRTATATGDGDGASPAADRCPAQALKTPMETAAATAARAQFRFDMTGVPVGGAIGSRRADARTSRLDARARAKFPRLANDW